MHPFVQSPADPLASPSGTSNSQRGSPLSSPRHDDADLALAMGRIPSPSHHDPSTAPTPLKPTLTLSPAACFRVSTCTIPSASSPSGFFRLPPAIQSQILSQCSIPHLTTHVLPVSRAMRHSVHHYLGRWLLSHAHLQGSLIVSSLGSGHAATAPPVGTVAFRASAVCPDRSLVAFCAPPLSASSTTMPMPMPARSLESHVASIVVDPAETSVWWSLKLNLAPSGHAGPGGSVVDRYKLVDYLQTGPYSDSPIDMHNGAYMIQTPRMVHVPGRGAFSVTVRESPTPDAARLLHIDLSPVVMPLMHVVHMFAARLAPRGGAHGVDAVSVTQPAARSSLPSTSEWMVRHADQAAQSTAEFVGKYTDALNRALCSPTATSFGQAMSKGMGMASPVLVPVPDALAPPPPPLWRPFPPAAVPANVTPPMPSSPLSLAAPAAAWPSSALAMSASYQMATMSPPAPATSNLVFSCGMSPPMAATGTTTAASPPSAAAAVRGSRAWAMSALRGWHKLSISDSQRLHSASHL